jgi:hypothetical protein
MSIVIAEAFRWVNSLAETVVSGASDWDEVSIECALDSRDADPFDSDWVRTDETLESHKALIAPEVRAEIDAYSNELRKRMFAAIIRASGSSELAGYVSDDFEMICSGLASGFGSEFFFSLVAAYVAGRVPDNSMQIVDKNPSDLY